ncbi:MAG: hypothetical protein ACJAXJ_003163 [Colwellia sp.]|jgi:hypothetical protein
MNIKTATQHFEHYLQGQVNAAMAVRKLAFLDQKIAKAAFNISDADTITFRSTLPDNVTKAALGNSQLFKLTVPNNEQLAISKELLPIYNIRFNSNHIKQCISKYCEAQRQCVLSIKSIFDLDNRLAKALFQLDEYALGFLGVHTSFDISTLSDRHTWFININYSEQDDIFKETVERVSFDTNFVESSILY